MSNMKVLVSIEPSCGTAPIAVSSDVRKLKRYAQDLVETELTWKREEYFDGSVRWHGILQDPSCIENGDELYYIHDGVEELD